MKDLIQLPTDIDWGTNKETVDFINQQFDEINKSVDSIIQRAILIGSALKQVQKNCKDDEFPKWIEANFTHTNLKKSSVYAYTSLAEHKALVKEAKSIREGLKVIGEFKAKKEPKTPKPDDSYPEITAFRKAISKKTSDEKFDIVQKMMDAFDDMLFEDVVEEDKKLPPELKNEIKALQKQAREAIKEVPKYDKYKKEELRKVLREITMLLKTVDDPNVNYRAT
jgi:hypothetical protein